MRSWRFSILMALCLCANCLCAQTWEQTNGPYGGYISSFAINSNDQLFAGTLFGEIFRSTDNGENWVQTNIDIMAGTTIQALAVNSNDDLFAGTDYGFYRSTDNGENWTRIYFLPDYIFALVVNSNDDIFAVSYYGTYRSTNNGESWARIDYGLNGSIQALAVNSNDELFAGTYNSGTWNNSLYRSTDNGENWVQVNSGFADSTAIFALTANSNDDLFARTYYKGIYRSTDNGENWVQINNGLIDTTQVLALIVNRNDDLFAGTYNGIYRSTDNGENWVHLNNGLGKIEIQALAVNSSDHLFAGDAGASFYEEGGKGVFRSTDNGENWIQINEGITEVLVNDFVIDKSGYFYAGTRCGAFRTSDNGDTWVQIYNGLTYTMAVNSNDDLFAGTSYGVYRSTNNGNNWVQVNSGLADSTQIFALTLNSNDDLFAGTSSGAYRSTDNGDNWVQINNGLTGSIQALAVNSNDDLFAGTYNSGTWNNSLYRSTDNGENWVQIINGFGDYELLNLVANGDYLFAGFWTGILRSTDGGYTWQEINSGLPNVYDYALYTLAVGDYSGHLFAGTSGGLYRSTDNGDNWVKLIDTGFPSDTVAVVGLDDDGYLFAASLIPLGVFRLYLDGEEPCTGLICDDFEDGLDPAWVQMEGTCSWDVTGGVLGTSLTGDQTSCVLSVGDNSWSNYIIEADVRGNDGVDKIVRFRQTDSETRYFVNIRSDYLGQDEVLLCRQKDGIETIFEIVPYPSQNDTWYHLKIACVDEHISVYIDNNLVISYDDVDSRIYSGGIGLVCFTGSVGVCDISFDNVMVTDPFPHVTFDTDPIFNVGDNISISGTMTYRTGEPYPAGYGDCVADNPLNGGTESVIVSGDGSFSCQLAGVAEATGTYMADIAVATGYGTARSYFIFAINNPAIGPPYAQDSDAYRSACFAIDLKMDLGQRDDLPSQTTQNVSAKPSFWHQYWSNIGSSVVDNFVEPTKDLYRQSASFVIGGWKRTTDSYSGRMAVGVFNAGVANSTPGQGIGQSLAVGGAVYVLGTETFANTFTDAFHQLVDIASNPADPILTPEEAARGHLLVDDFSMVLTVLRLNPTGEGLLEAATTTADAGLLIPEYFDLVNKHLELNNKNGLGAENYESLSFIVVDSSNEIMVIGIEPKLENVCVVQSFSPVKLSITDPRGRIVDWESSDVPGSRYFRMDTDQDGDSSTLVIIPLDTIGPVSVTIVPDVDAQPDDSFTVIMDNTYYQEPITLVENMPISAIPTQPLVAETFENLPPDSVHILTENGAIFVEFPCALEWHPAVDPNPGHIPSYRVVIAREPDFSDSVAISVSTDTSYLFDGSLPLPLKNVANTLVFHWKVIASDDWGATAATDSRSFYLEFSCGDANGDAQVNVGDAVFIINYVFKGGPAPDPVEAGDANCDGNTDVGDAVYLINYVFKGGPDPCASCK